MSKRNLFLFTLILFTSSAHAIVMNGAVTDIAGTGAGRDAYDQQGVFTELTLPFNPPNGSQNTVGEDTFQTPNLYAFNEGQNILLNQAYSVDIGTALVSGNTISSHYVFFDPNNSTDQQGWVDFDADIIAVITSTTNLDASDSFLNNNVNYLNPAARGLERGDIVSIGDGLGSNLNRLYVDWKASSPGDFVRVITGFSQGGQDPCSTNPAGVGGCPASGGNGGTVPEPAPFSLLFAGMISIAIARRFHAKKI